MSSAYVEDIYRRAARETGKSIDALREMAEQVFASMLLHALARPSVVIWTAATIDERGLNVEVDLPPRLRKAQ